MALTLKELCLLLATIGLAVLLVPLIQVILKLKQVLGNLDRLLQDYQALTPDIRATAENLARHSARLGEPIDHLAHITGQADHLATRVFQTAEKVGGPLMKVASIAAGIGAGVNVFKKILPQRGKEKGE